MSFLIWVLVLIAAGYLFLIMPRMADRPDYSPLFGWHYAHRGLHDNATEAPENSLEAFRLAVENGYGVEFDVQLTKDKVPIVFHDDTLDRVCGVHGNVWEFTWEELQKLRLCGSSQGIPLFTEVLDVLDGKVPAIIEYKMHDTSVEVCEVADPILQGYDGDYCIESFSPFPVRWYRQRHPQIIRGQLSTYYGGNGKRESAVQFAAHMLLTNVICRPDFIAYDSNHTGNLSRVLCRKLFGALSVVWTIRSEEELRKRRGDYDLFIFEHFRATEDTLNQMK